ncbi:serine hydrolase domain-containing protein [Arenicella xantha]|uniref:CubicO group peptidase (Beta-lactamase class C family) n=1 Tax=Arenicella xantha TaxID=644221 RepID=A0A395JI57_9GAMM|nr:serine hydrolase domain-containing protein [Arenicella xantha]RBP49363.1 CubicO group peptidase (beta-lactamase class C family) [Arenicella xantha]
MNDSKFLLKIAFCTFLIGISTIAQSKDLTTGMVAHFPDFNNPKLSANFDPEKIKALENRMQRFVAEGDTMGIATLLVHNGEVISHSQAGVRNILAGKPITHDTIYRIYSMTKPITGVAMMMLYEEGKFSLDDPVSKFIPEFSNLEVVKSYDKDGNVELEPLERQPTMRELMSHTAGFAYGLYGDDPANRAFMSKGVLASPDLQTFIDRVASIPLMHQPGTDWFYSASVDIQGAIIERITGQTLGSYFNSKIFTPLGMKDTAFYVPEEKSDRLSDVFAYHPVSKKFQAMPFTEPEYNFFGDMSFKKETRAMESGGGGLVSTLADYARFCQMLANNGEFQGVRILNPESITLMRSNVLRDDQTVNIAGNLTESQIKTLGFGLNVGTFRNIAEQSQTKVNSSYYWGGAAGTWFWIDPDNNLYFIGMIQRFDQGGPHVDFRAESRKLVYDALRE